MPCLIKSDRVGAMHRYIAASINLPHTNTQRDASRSATCLRRHPLKRPPRSLHCTLSWYLRLQPQMQARCAHDANIWRLAQPRACTFCKLPCAPTGMTHSMP